MPFLSEIRGRPVFDDNGSQVGTVGDVLVSADKPYPPVESIIVKFRDGEYTVPWSAVAAVAPTGTSLRTAFEPSTALAPDESLVWLGRDVLDKQIVDTHGVKLVRVNDIALTRLNSELHVAGVDGSTRGLLRRLGFSHLSKRPPTLIDWEQVDISPAVREVRLKVGFDGLRRMHPADIARIAEQMSPAEAADVFEVLDDETAAKAMAELPDEHQAAVLTAMDPAEAADVLDEMEPDEAADVLGDVSEERAAELMSLMDPQAALEVQTLLQYAENTAGGLMTTNFVTLVEGEPVESGLRAVCAAVANGDEVDQIYITDTEGRFRGSIPLAQLIAAPAQIAVEMVMARDVRTVPLEEPDEEVARLLVHYGLLSVPVVDDSRKLMGVVGIADVIDLFAPRTWRSRPRSVRA